MKLRSECPRFLVVLFVMWKSEAANDCLMIVYGDLMRKSNAPKEDAIEIVFKM